MIRPSPAPHVALVGSGPAGLMAAHKLSSSGIRTTLFEKRKASGRKLLIAGSSGLNISYDCPESELARHYRGGTSSFERVFQSFSRESWLQFIENLGLETFKGTSRRYFVREMKAAGLLKAWTEQLKKQGVLFEFGKEVVDFNSPPPSGSGRKCQLTFSPNEVRSFEAIGFFLGGGSWEPEEAPLRWPSIFERKQLRFSPFESSNTGFEVHWPPPFLKEAEGLPIKSIELKTPRGAKKGELVVTKYGLEGTPIYAIGCKGVAHLDLKPGLSAKEIEAKLSTPKKENLSPIRRIKKDLGLCPAAEALLFHFSTPSQRSDLRQMVLLLKSFPLVLENGRPLAESISSSGGLQWNELNESLMIKRFPGVFAGGEMLDWDAPTGGFLIQGCVSQGYYVAEEILKYLNLGR